MNTDIQPWKIIGLINANDNHLAVLPLLTELLRCTRQNCNLGVLDLILGIALHAHQAY